MSVQCQGPSLVPSSCSARTLLTVYWLFVGNQTALSTPFVLSLPTPVSPPGLLSCPNLSFLQLYALPRSPCLPYLTILSGHSGVPDGRAAVFTSSLLPHGVLGLCAIPPKEHTQKTPQQCRATLHTSAISLAVTRAGLCFQMDSDVFTSHPQSPPRSGGQIRPQVGNLAFCNGAFLWMVKYTLEKKMLVESHMLSKFYN